jgi:hypothetical protein
MTPRLAHLLTRLYPRAWRDRYAHEFEQLLESTPANLRTSLNVLVSAFTEHITPTQGAPMNPQPNSFNAIVRQPAAFVPVAMSLTALTIVIIHISIYGVTHDPDEGTAAHLWQLLMAGQLPVLLYFAIKYLPRAPKQTLYVLALQAGAALASLAPVFFLNL